MSADEHIRVRRQLRGLDLAGSWPLRFNLRRYQRTDERERAVLRPVIEAQMQRFSTGNRCHDQSCRSLPI